MSYTGNPSDSDKDLIRFRVGDVYDQEIVSDNEINYLLSLYSVDKAIIETINVMLPRVSKNVNEKVGDVEIDYSDWYENLKDALNNLKESLSPVGGIYSGGTFTADDSLVNGSDIIESIFYTDDWWARLRLCLIRPLRYWSK